MDNKIRYIGAKTDKGFVKGDLYQGITFVNENEARLFTKVEAELYAESIAADVFEFYGCKTIKFVVVDIKYWK